MFTISRVAVKQSLSLLVAALAIVGGCDDLRPVATQEQMDGFGSSLSAADKGVLMIEGSEPLTLPEDELREVIAAFASDNLQPWGNYTKSAVYGPVVFFAHDVELTSIEYYDGSICQRGGVYVKLKRDPLKKFIQQQRTTRH
jgi:hypothetical protein